ncbi:hypothetical protein [Desulfurococcus mucosus]|uniref:hypothetical protein n=1 Tax=Desulfurococcus mucosus TaxID=2275 RepID=UPI00064F940F|nr:hypothetical protein [Desulfurococcus mucosus]
MPSARSWVEELAAEYYMLRRYVVNFDVPIGVGRRGGRVDADIIAVNPLEKEVHIIDIKSIWTGKEEVIVRGIVSRLRRAEELFLRIYGRKYRYVKRAIIIGEAERPEMLRIIEALKREGVEARSFKEFLAEVVDYMGQWRNEQRELRLARPDTKPALPENLPLLKLLEYLKDAGMLGEGLQRTPQQPGS